MAASASVASVRLLEQKVERWMKRVNRTLEELGTKLSQKSLDLSVTEENESIFISIPIPISIPDCTQEVCDAVPLIPSEPSIPDCTQEVCDAVPLVCDAVPLVCDAVVPCPHRSFYFDVVPTEPFHVDMNALHILQIGTYRVDAEVTLVNTDITDHASAVVELSIGDETLAQSAASWWGRWDGSESGRGLQTLRITGKWRVDREDREDVAHPFRVRILSRHATTLVVCHQTLFPCKVWIQSVHE